MTVQYSTAYRNTILDQFETTLGTAAVIEIRTGAQPANVAAAETGTLLVTLDSAAPSDWAAAASSGAKALAAAFSGLSVATGTMGHYLVKTSGGTRHEQGSVTISGGGGDMTFDSITVSATGQQVTLSAWVKTAGGA